MFVLNASGQLENGCLRLEIETATLYTSSVQNSTMSHYDPTPLVIILINSLTIVISHLIRTFFSYI